MSNGSQIVPAVLISAEAAKYLGVSLSTLNDYVAHGLIDVVRLPKRSRDRKKSDSLSQPRRKLQFRRQDLDAFIERQIQPAKAATASPTGGRRFGGKNVIEQDWWKRASR